KTAKRSATSTDPPFTIDMSPGRCRRLGLDFCLGRHHVSCPATRRCPHVTAPKHLTFMIKNLRNIAIIAHVDHGKTTLVDCLLRQSGTMDARDDAADRIMDTNDLERERGITITSK